MSFKTPVPLPRSNILVNHADLPPTFRPNSKVAANKLPTGSQRIQEGETGSEKNDLYEACYSNIQDIHQRPKTGLKSDAKRCKERKQEKKGKAEEQIEEKEDFNDTCYSNIQVVFQGLKNKLKSEKQNKEGRRKTENQEEGVNSKEQQEVREEETDAEKEDLYGSEENIYEPLDHFDDFAVTNRPLGLMKPAEAFNIPKSPPPVPRRRKEEASYQTEYSNLDLIFYVKDFLEGEKYYVGGLQKALETSEELKRKGFSKDIILNCFGLLKDLHIFHKETLLKELEICAANPTNIPICFVKHAAKFRIYIERQWLIPNKSDLSEFEVIGEINVKPYINITQARVAEYIRTLQYLKYNCNRNSQKATNQALKVVENLYYQLEMIQNLKKVEDINNKFKECGEVYLDRTFKVSINGTKRKSYLVYLCEHLVIFTILKDNGTYHHVHDILTSKCYCCVLKLTSTVFEIGVKGRKRFTMKAESLAVKRKWCKQLEQILSPDLFEES